MEEEYWKEQIIKTILSLEISKNDQRLAHLSFLQDQILKKVFYQFEDSLSDVSLKLEKNPKDLKLNYLKKNLLTIIEAFKHIDIKILLTCVLSHRFDKWALNLPHTIISGEDGGFFYLLNSPSEEEINLLKNEEIPADYLQKITLDSTTNKMVIGEGGCGKIRLSIALTINESARNGEITMHIGEILCVKKSKHVGYIEDDEEITINEVRMNVWNDYFVGGLAKYLHSPNVYDILQVDLCDTPEKLHKKGYTFQQFLPIYDGNIFKKKRELQTWRHQKKYFLDIMIAVNELLDQGVCMTDLKPGNTLYDSENMKGKLIDLAGVVRKKSRMEMESCKVKYIQEYTPDFSAPELIECQDPEMKIDLCKAICFNFGVMIDKLVFKVKLFDCLEKDKLKKLYFELIKPDPNERIPLCEAIKVISEIGENNLEKNSYNINEFMKAYKCYLNSNIENLENFSLNREIRKLKELFIEAKVSEIDPEKYPDFNEEDLNPLISFFFDPNNIKTSVFLLMGASGSGKSTILQIKFLETLEKWTSGDPIPFYLNLSSEQELKKQWKFLNEELKKKTELMMEISFSLFSGILSYPIALFLDSFDEGRIQINLVQKIYEDLGFNIKNKILITCRSNYLHSQEEIKEKFKIGDLGLIARYITPLNLHKTDLKGYLKRFLSFSNKMEQVEEYDERFEQGDLKDSTKTNFMFHLVLEVLPEFKPNEPISNYKVYEKYTKKRFINESERLANVLKEDIKKEYNNEAIFDLAEDLARELASNLFYNRKVFLDSNENYEFFTKYHFSKEKPFKSQNLFNLCKIIDLRLETQGKPPNEKIKIGFSHDSIKFFFLANQILKQLVSDKTHDFLLSREIIKEEIPLIKFLSENIKHNEILIKTLKSYIMKTRQHKDLNSCIASSNAMTLLIASNVNFINEDLTSVVIRNADIRGGIFTGSDFSNAGLTNVDLSGCKLQETLFKKTIMKDVKLGLFHPDIKTEVGILCLDDSRSGQEIICGCKGGKVIYYSRHKNIKNIFKRSKSLFWLERSFEGHSASVLAVSFSPDETLIISGSCDQNINIWQKSNGKLLKTLIGHEGWVTSASFSLNSKLVLSSGTDYAIKLWDFDSGKVLKSVEVGFSTINSCCFSPKENYILTASKDMTLKLLHGSSLEFIRKFEGHSAFINKAIFSPDGKEIISCGNDQTLILWETETSNIIRTFIGHSNWINSVCFSPDGMFILSAGCDKSVKLWEKKSGKIIKTFEGHSSEIKSALYSKNGLFMLSAGLDNLIKIWENSDKKALKIFQGHSQGVCFTSFSKDESYLLSASTDSTIKIWDRKSAGLIKTLRGHIKWVNSAFFSLNSDTILSASADNTIKIWDVSSGKCIKTLCGHSNFVNFACFSPDEKLIVSGGEDILINIWDVLTGSLIKSIPNGHEFPITCVAFSPNGDYILSASTDEKLKLWETNSGNMIRVFEGHSNSIKSCSFSPDGAHIISSSVDSTIKLWGVDSGNLLNTFNGHKDAVNSCCFSPDGKSILSGGDDKSIRLWDVKEGKELEILQGHEDLVNSVMFSCDGMSFVSGSEDKTIKIWEKTKGENKKQKKKWILTNEMSSGESGLLCDGMMILDCIELSQLNEGIIIQKKGEKS